MRGLKRSWSCAEGIHRRNLATGLTVEATAVLPLAPKPAFDDVWLRTPLCISGTSGFWYLTLGRAAEHDPAPKAGLNLDGTGMGGFIHPREQ